MSNNNELILKCTRAGGMEMAIKFGEALIRGDDVKELSKEYIELMKKELVLLKDDIKKDWTDTTVIDMPISGGETVEHEPHSSFVFNDDSDSDSDSDSDDTD